MKRVVFSLLILIGLGMALSAQTSIFDRNCVSCHRREGVSLRRTFMNALLIYSGEQNMKAGLKYFLRHPSKETSVMGEEYFRTHRLKAPTTLTDSELDAALDTYWQRYKVIGNLR